ncbi:MAG: pilus assembly protein TadE [Alphaproteobacteria bacterium]|nr:MAG: pilus assembly protein TadE [Alphaproteobacteria bacterium]
MSKAHDNARRGLRRYLQAPRIVRRFRRKDDGTTAVEFAILAFPFFLLLFGIIESSLLFFAGQMLESSVDDVGRKVRTGQLDDTLTESQFKNEICSATALLFDCSKLKVDLKVAAKFDDLEDPPTPENGEIDHSAYGFAAPCPEQIAMITVSYEWPVFTNYVVAQVSALNSRNALLNAMAVFRTEPYPAHGGSC